MRLDLEDNLITSDNAKEKHQYYHLCPRVCVQNCKTHQYFCSQVHLKNSLQMLVAKLVDRVDELVSHSKKKTVSAFGWRSPPSTVGRRWNIFSVKQLEFKRAPEKPTQTDKYHSGIQYYAFLSSSKLYATSAANYPTPL